MIGKYRNEIVEDQGKSSPVEVRYGETLSSKQWVNQLF